MRVSVQYRVVRVNEYVSSCLDDHFRNLPFVSIPYRLIKLRHHHLAGAKFVRTKAGIRQIPDNDLIQ